VFTFLKLTFFKQINFSLTRQSVSNEKIILKKKKNNLKKYLNVRRVIFE